MHGCEVRVYREHRARRDGGKHTVRVYEVGPSEERHLLGGSDVGATVKTAVQNGVQSAIQVNRKRLEVAGNALIEAARTTKACVQLRAALKAFDQESEEKEANSDE